MNTRRATIFDPGSSVRLKQLHQSPVNYAIPTIKPTTGTSRSLRRALLVAACGADSTERSRETAESIFHDANQCSAGTMWRSPVMGYKGKSGAVQRGLDDQILIVQNQRAADRDRHRLVAFLEFPFVDALAAVAEVDTRWLSRSRGDIGLGCDSKYEGAPTIACWISGETRTATMSCAMYSPK
jgi:hypothetical protein